jgi:hypothetical protein
METKPPHVLFGTFYLYDFQALEFEIATAAQRGVWIGLWRYAVYENRGARIVGALKEPERYCRGAFRCSRRELAKSNPLLVVDGDDMVVWGYPDDQRFKEIRRRISNTERKRRYRQNQGGQ